MQTPNFHTTPNWILSHLPFISCALPLPAEWHGNSSRIHALLLAISTGTVLLRCLRTKAGMQGILEGLLSIYETQGDFAAVMRTAQAIMQKPVKIQSPAVTEIKTRAQQYVYRN